MYDCDKKIFIHTRKSFISFFFTKQIFMWVDFKLTNVYKQFKCLKLFYCFILIYDGISLFFMYKRAIFSEYLCINIEYEACEIVETWLHSFKNGKNNGRKYISYCSSLRVVIRSGNRMKGFARVMELYFLLIYIYLS